MTRGSRSLLVGIVAWVAITIAFWPTVASFADDVGYIGQARLLLAGHLRPHADDLGIWQLGVSKYPLFLSALLAPLLAVWPRAIFAVGIVAAVATCWLAARILESWGDDPAAALLLLAHPTMILIARTATADVPECAFMLGAWWCFRNDRWRAAIACCAGLFAIKATGIMIGAALLGGEILRRLPALRHGERSAYVALAVAALAMIAGVAVVVLCNQLSAGRSWFGYDFGGIRPFSPAHFSSTAPRQALNVLVIPPLLIAGALPFWRRREFGPLAVVVGFGTAMCFYFYVDYGNSLIETMVLAPRLLLPVVAFLLVGYADLLTRLFRPFSGGIPALRTITTAVALVAALAIGSRHARWQREAATALSAAERIARAADVHELGVLPEADKAGIMFSGRVVRADPAHPTEQVLLCTVSAASYRAPMRDGALSCDVPGYRAVYQAGSFSVLIGE